MRKAVLEKFRQNPQLLQRLLATDDARLVEHTPTDACWGDGGEGSGLNRLGEILLEIRAELREKQRHFCGLYLLRSRHR